MHLCWQKVVCKKIWSILLKAIHITIKPNGDPYVVYGDPAYGLSHNILAPFRGAHLTVRQKQFNTRMSKVRTSVEWGFRKICQYFSFLDFKKNLKVLLQPVGKCYLVACILINCHTCLYGSVTSSYFNIDPPNLEKCLTNTWEIFKAHLTVLDDNWNITGKYIFILFLCHCLCLILNLSKNELEYFIVIQTNIITQKTALL